MTATMTLADVVAEVSAALGIEKLAPEDDLIEAGLDSIRMMRLAGQWRRQGYDIDFATMAARPTASAWAEILGAQIADTETGDTQAGDAGASQEDRESARDDAETFALAPMQHAYWVGRSAEQELGGVSAHLYVEFDADNDLDPERLQQVLRRLVGIHPMLRAVIDDAGRQHIGPVEGVRPLAVNDWRTLDDDERETALQQVRSAKTHQRLDVAAGQVIDVTLSRLPGGRSRLHLDVDMLAADAVSYRVLIDDLARLYRGEAVTEPQLSFRDYLSSRAGTAADPADELWWAQRLDELPEPPALPVRAGAENSATVRLHHWIDEAQTAAVHAAARSASVTTAAALASVFASSIGRWSANSSFLLNLPLFDREPIHPDIDRVVGDFTSSVLIDVPAATDGDDAASRARELQRRMYANAAHNGCSGLEVLRELGRRRGRQMIAPVVYTSALGLGELFSGAAREVFGSPVWIVSQGPQVLLDAQVTEFSGGLLLNWDVRADAFEDGVVEEMFDDYRRRVDALAARRPEGAPSGPDVAPHHRGPRMEFDIRALHAPVFEHAATSGAAPAIIATGETVNYRDLAARALRVASALRAGGVAPGDTVAVRLPKGPDQVVAVVGVLSAGAAYLPISVDQPPNRARMIIEKSGAAALLGEPITGEPVIGANSSTVPVISLADALAGSPLTEPVIADPTEVAYVLYTSGSTGEPKGVEVTHAAAANTIAAINDRWSIGAQDRSLGLSALEFDLSVYDIFGMFAAGGAVVAATADQRRDPFTWPALVADHRVSVVNVAPGLLRVLLERLTEREDAAASLRLVITGGDWVDTDLPRMVAELNPHTAFAGLGGATETAIHSTICETTGATPDVDLASSQAAARAVPYGYPMANMAARVTDEAGADRPDWVPGELWLGGAGVAVGYRGDAVRTAEKFVEIDGIRWYRTGDLARYLPDGCLEFLGRADHQVKVRGHRVELGEVEAACRDIDRVTDAVAWLDDSTPARLVAACGVRSGGGESATDADVIRDGLAARLPDYMIPSVITVLAELPLTVNGKLDRVAIRIAAQSDPQMTVEAAVSPEGPVEEAVADIVADILDLDEVSVTADFFALGGDSVRGTAVIATIRESLETTALTAADLFAARTARALAARLVERTVAAEGTDMRLIEMARLYLEVAAMSDEELYAESPR
ncbi:non-ribosomal peptide synthetase [Gordonia jinhuaensis]